jgi:membrane associated rhomboid family serine protease
MTEKAPPSRDRPTEPIFNVPYVVLALCALFLAIYAAFDFADASAQDFVLRNFAFVPGRLTFAIWPGGVEALLARAQTDSSALEKLRALRDFGFLGQGAKVWTLATYALLHGSWTHVGLNTIWLIAFGPPVARRFGTPRFLLFFLVTALAGGLAHWASAPTDYAPLIGASAADSGLMAAAARFVFQPGGPLGEQDLSSTGVFPNPPALPLTAVFTDRRTLMFVGVWLVTNVIFGAGAQTLGIYDGPVAWVAHMGGFFAGLLLFPLFDRRHA